MLRNIVHLSIRSIHSAKFLRIDNLTSTTRCKYSRWVSRRPVAIINEDELFDKDDKDDTQTKISKPVKKYISKARKEKLKKKEKKKPEEVKEEVVTNGPIYKPLDENDKFISSLMINIRTKKRREKNGQILLEGSRLIQDAIQAGVMPQIIFFNRLADVLQLSLPKEVQLYKIPYRTIQLWSTLTTSPGIFGIFDIPDVENNTPANDAIPLTIICDNIREPGNLGSIIRTAAAVGCEKLLLMKGCVDIWEPKVLRGAVGAHFRVSIHRSLSWDDIPALISNESTIYLTDNNMTYDHVSRDNTVSDTSTETDWADTEDGNSDIDINQSTETDKTIKPLKINSHKPTAKTKALVRQIISQFPIVPYHTLDFAKKEVVLIIGGETEGISLQSCDLLRDRNCIRVNISLTNGIESLNTASALSVITFEIRRQFITRTIGKE
ncbi:rRNA methyltransferase 3, mitochondrial [Harpegnathos saltator]|uniref:RNA methyltransferase-like protein 1 n=1 Tax=Harpegnathos saltator TaxID=610380 RepID=E2BZ53_HARSA|nr:rRNA methyltransferase 3, mitochondrial [Harpegnathos saltator]EFN79022.1 RNA methyltransferase-like protein 1 [Harpegnathos saltator]